MARECATPAKTLNEEGELREYSQTPHQQQSINSQHSLPDPKPKLTLMKAAKKRGWQEVAPVPFLNPDPKACLVGYSNEPLVVVDGHELTALVDSGAQVLSIKCSILQRLYPANSAPGLVVGIRGDRGCSHPIPQICGG